MFISRKPLSRQRRSVVTFFLRYQLIAIIFGCTPSPSPPPLPQPTVPRTHLTHTCLSHSVLTSGLPFLTRPLLEAADGGQVLMNMVQGVSRRLDSSIHSVRQAGMRVAHGFSSVMGQPLCFEGLIDDLFELVAVICQWSSVVVVVA